jgi:hypothetical protein
VAQAQAAMRRLQTQREENNLPVLKRTPKFSECVKEYLAFYETVKDTKRPKTLQTERGHFFVSYCVMSGIDFMTIARWAGHQEGGVLIGKVYGHLSNEHAQRQAQRVNFGATIMESMCRCSVSIHADGSQNSRI